MMPPIADADLIDLITLYVGHDITSWNWAPIDFNPVNPSTGGLYRLSGDGWSLVMKVLRATDNSPDIPQHWNYWKREALAYESGIPQRLPAGTATPKYAGAIADPTDPSRLCLFMEDVQDDPTQPWSLADDAAVAKSLGQWGALALHEPIETPWLCPAWLRGALQVGAFVMPLLDRYEVWDRPEIAREFPPAMVERIRHFLSEADRLTATLETLPRVLCHFDAHRANIMRRQAEFVIIDWASVGLGAPGEEIGHLFSTNLLSGFVPAEQVDEHAEALIAGYTKGLTAAGADIDEQTVRTGFTLSAALRAFGFTLPMTLLAAADPAHPKAISIVPRVAAATRVLLPYLDKAL